MEVLLIGRELEEWTPITVEVGCMAALLIDRELEECKSIIEGIVLLLTLNRAAVAVGVMCVL